MTRRKLQRIATDATQRALRCESTQDHNKPSDFGQAARYWQRLADAADALDAYLAREEQYASATPPSSKPFGNRYGSEGQDSKRV